MDFKEETAVEQPQNVCLDCGKYWGNLINIGISDITMGLCDVCKSSQPLAVVKPVAFGYLKKGWNK